GRVRRMGPRGGRGRAGPLLAGRVRPGARGGPAVVGGLDEDPDPPGAGRDRAGRGGAGGRRPRVRAGRRRGAGPGRRAVGGAAARLAALIGDARLTARARGRTWLEKELNP